MIDPITIHNTTTPDQLLFMDPKDYREHWLLSAFADCNIIGNHQPFTSSLTSPSYRHEESNNTSLSVEDATAIANLMSESDDNDMAMTENKASYHPLQQQKQKQQQQHQQEHRPTVPTLPLTSTSQHSKSSDSTMSSSDGTTTPTDVDILCGQSRNCACHPGNRKFQVILDSYVLKYKIASNKQEKMVLTKEIVRRIASSGGRFLKYSTTDKNWQEISTIAARDKVSHALRTKVASWSKKQQQGKKDGSETQTSSTAQSSATAAAAAPAPAPAMATAQSPNVSVSTKERTNKKEQQIKKSTTRTSRKTHRRRQQETTSSEIITASFDANDPTVPSMLMDSFSIEL